MAEEDKTWFLDAQSQVWADSMQLYKEALNRGVAKEQARFLLPLGTETKLYMCGSLRSWVHYCEVRCDKSTQLEHRDIALAIRDIVAKEFPDVAKALGWEA